MFCFVQGVKSACRGVSTISELDLVFVKDVINTTVGGCP